MTYSLTERSDGIKRYTINEIDDNTVRLYYYDKDGTVLDIIEGPLQSVLNCHVLRDTGLRVYRDRRRK